MYLYLSNNQSDQLYSGNTASMFRIKLPTKIDVQPRGEWEVAILDIDLPALSEKYSPSYITINSKICISSVFNSTMRPMLNRVYGNELLKGSPHYFDCPRYVPLSVESLEHVDIYLIDSKGITPSFKEGQVSCTLHIRQNA